MTNKEIAVEVYSLLAERGLSPADISEVGYTLTMRSLVEAGRNVIEEFQGDNCAVCHRAVAKGGHM